MRSRRILRWVLGTLVLVLGLGLGLGLGPGLPGPVPDATAASVAGVVRLKDSSVFVGQRVVARGRVTHGARKVRIQVRRVGSPWRRLATTRSRSTGRFRAAFVAPSWASRHQVRAVAPRARVRGKRRARMVTRAVHLDVRPSPASLAVLPQERAMFAVVNTARALAGCAAVVHHDRLHVAARGHSVDMARAGRLSHVGTDGSTFAQRATSAGYRWSAVGENVAYGQRTVTEVMTSWMNSPTHRAIILSCGFTELGVGLAVDKDGRPYWTQLFGRPR